MHCIVSSAINIKDVPQNSNEEQFSGLHIVYRHVIELGLGMAAFINAVAISY